MSSLPWVVVDNNPSLLGLNDWVVAHDVALKAIVVRLSNLTISELTYMGENKD